MEKLDEYHTTETAELASRIADSDILRIVKGAPLLSPADTVRRAAGLVREFEGSQLPVSDQGRIAGVITERTIAAFLAGAEDLETALESPLEPLITAAPILLNRSVSLRDAARAFAATDADTLPVIDNEGRFSGVVLRRDVVGLLTRTMRPPTVAGMATPLGVFLTTGAHTGGAGNLGLFLTGASLAVIMLAALLITDGMAKIFGAVTGIPVGVFLASPPLTARLNVFDLAFYITTVLSVVVFGILLRLSPLSGYHAAEHMTVHAIEVGEALTVESVRRMPRVHPRCGTNLLAAAGVFMIIVSRLSGGAAVVLALIVVLIGWRTVGGWLQYLVTTRTPSDRQIASGVEAGRELLQKFQEQPNVQVSGFERLWRIGLLQTAAGLAATYTLIFKVLDTLGISIP